MESMGRAGQEGIELERPGAKRSGVERGGKEWKGRHGQYRKAIE